MHAKYLVELTIIADESKRIPSTALFNRTKNAFAFSDWNVFWLFETKQPWFQPENWNYWSFALEQTFTISQ